MKVLIAYPPIKSRKGIPLLSQNRQFQYFNNPTFIYPLVPASAATLLKEKGYEVLYKDAIREGITSDQFHEYVAKQKPDVIAIETKTPVVKRHWKIINHLKNLSTDNWQLTTVLMGDHVTALPQESMEESKVDFVITGGDYDFMLLGLCEYLEGKCKLKEGFWFRENGEIKNTGSFLLSDNLDDLPIIDRKLTNSQLYNIEYNIKVRPFAYTMVGRDCPYHRCRFCSWTTLFPKFRVRKPELLLDEIGLLIEKYKVREVFDDSGTFPPSPWLDEFCHGMIDRGYNKKISFSCNMRVDFISAETAKLMKKANFRLLKVGLESAKQETLDRLNKGIKVEQITNACDVAKKAGLDIHLTIMVGFPWETRSDAMKTQRLAKKLMTTGKAGLLQSTVIIPYPGTPLYRESIENDWLRFPADNYERFDMSEPVLKTPDMTAEEVMEMCNHIYSIFRSPKYIMRSLLSIRSPTDIIYYLRGLKAVVGHHRDFKRKGMG